LISRKNILIAGVLLAILIMATLFAQARHGRVNTALLAKLARGGTDPQSAAAQEEIRSMGTNAIPGLLTALKGYFSTPRKQLSAWAMRTPWMIKVRQRVSFFEPEDELRAGACSGFRTLGPLAKHARAALEDCLDDPTAALWAIQVLAMNDNRGELILGSEVAPSLLKGLTNASIVVRNISAEGLGHAQTNANVLVPALLNALSDSDVHVRATAAFELGGPIFQMKKAQIIPALIPLLSDSQPEVRRMAAVRLGLYGTNAISALSLVTHLSTQDSDPLVRAAASESAQRIANIDSGQVNVSPDTEAAVTK
jgi:hypothetical protein